MSISLSMHHLFKFVFCKTACEGLSTQGQKALNDDQYFYNDLSFHF